MSLSHDLVSIALGSIALGSIALGLALALPVLLLSATLTTLLLRRVRANVAGTWALGAGLGMLLIILGTLGLALFGSAALDTYYCSVDTGIVLGCTFVTVRAAHERAQT